MKTRTAQLLQATGVIKAQDRMSYENSFGSRLAIAADTADTFNRELIVAGTNMTTALCTFAAGGGITITTAGASGDTSLISPNGVSGVSPFFQAYYGSSQPGAYFRVKTAANIRHVRYDLGFWNATDELTNYTTNGSSLTAMRFVYDPTITGSLNWFVNIKDGGRADWRLADTGVEVEPGTQYTLAIETLSDLNTTYSVRHQHQGWKWNAARSKQPLSTAGAAKVLLSPQIAVRANEAAAKALTVRQMAFGINEG